jgi:putative oxidoreductase
MRRLFSSKYSDNSISFALLLLRIFFGGLIIPHGYDKLMNITKYKGFFAQAHMDPFHVGTTGSLYLIIFAEFFCGILVVLGLLTRFACVCLCIGMAVAVIVSHHWKIMGDGEHATLYFGCFLALLFAGPGKFSFDRLIGK